MHISMYILIVVSLMLLKEVFSVNISKYIILVIISIFLVTCSHKKVFFSYVIFLIPLLSGLPNNLLTLTIVVVYFVKFNDKKIPNYSLFFIMIMMVYELLHFMILPFSLYQWVIDVLYLILFTIIMLNSKEIVDYRDNIFRMFFFSVFLSSSIILYKLLGEYSFNQIISLGIRLGIDKNVNSAISLQWNPNSIAIFSVVSFGLFVIIDKKRIYDYLLIFFVTIYGFMTLSRNFIISLAILLLLLFIFISFRKKMSILITVLIVGVAIYNFIPGIIDNFIDRFLVSDLSNDRNTINGYYLKEILSSPLRLLFGTGMQDYQVKYNYYESVHNAIIELIACWGICGFLFFIIMVILMVVKAKTKFNTKGVVLLFVFVLSIQASRLITTPEMLIILSMILSLCIFQKDLEFKRTISGCRLYEKNSYKV